MAETTVVLVTGCSSGIGRSLCEALSEKGYEVIATARELRAIEALRASMKARMDVTDPESIRRVVGEAIGRFGKIDVLVNNAGYSIRGALELIPGEEVKRMLDVNVVGIMNMLTAVLPSMRARKSGKIINVGSISGKFAQPLNGIYCASKFAVEALSDTMRIELGLLGIQATVIEPGPVKTNFQATADANLFGQDAGMSGCYDPLYRTDETIRSRQRYAEARIAAGRVADIIAKPKLRQRYKVAVPFSSGMIAGMNSRYREFILSRFYGVTR